MVFRNKFFVAYVRLYSLLMVYCFQFSSLPEYELGALLQCYKCSQSVINQNTHERDELTTKIEKAGNKTDSFILTECICCTRLL